MVKKQYTRYEEIANFSTHGAGILLGAAAGVWLLIKAFHCDFWVIGSVSVYIVCMIFSYVASTFYHASKAGKRKATLRKLDHVAIYFHIAGTYTFFTLTVLRQTGWWGWILFFTVWIAALAGSFISLKGKGIGNRLETVCYVVMGLVVFVAFKPLFDMLHHMESLEILWFIIAGGVSFVLGALLYTFKTVPYIHSIFHLFVLGGSFFHIWAIDCALGWILYNN